MASKELRRLVAVLVLALVAGACNNLIGPSGPEPERPNPGSLVTIEWELWRGAHTCIMGCRGPTLQLLGQGKDESSRSYEFTVTPDTLHEVEILIRYPSDAGYHIKTVLQGMGKIREIDGGMSGNMIGLYTNLQLFIPASPGTYPALITVEKTSPQGHTEVIQTEIGLRVE